MPVFVSMLRGVNVGGHNKIKMEELRALYESLGMRDAQTYIQSGNVVFKAKERDAPRLAERIADGILEPGKLLVVFLAADPDAEARAKVLGINVGPEELRIDGRELYIYFRKGQGQSKLTLPVVEKTLRMPGTGRNWNTVAQLLEMAERLEAS
jgi:uncharacterized protein (DUF1697 family)